MERNKEERNCRALKFLYYELLKWWWTLLTTHANTSMNVLMYIANHVFLSLNLFKDGNFDINLTALKQVKEDKKTHWKRTANGPCYFVDYENLQRRNALRVGCRHWRALSPCFKPLGWDCLGDLKAGGLPRPVSTLARGLISWLSR